MGERDRALSSDRQSQCVHRRFSTRSGGRDDVRADCREPAWGQRQRRQGRARRHRQHADGLGHLRQPHDRGRRRGAGDGRREDQGQGEAPHRAPAGGGARGHRLRGRQVLREGIAQPRQDDSGHRAHGQRRLEHAARHGSGARGDELLRSAELRVSRLARTSPWSKSIQRQGTSI